MWEGRLQAFPFARPHYKYCATQHSNALPGVSSLIHRQIVVQYLESCGVFVRCECFFLLISRKPSVSEILKKPV